MRRTDEFVFWLQNLWDRKARAKIALRIDRLEDGNFGDVKFFDGIGEMRIHYGPGYRVYFAKRGDIVVILLCGGDKSTQSKDIEKAKRLAEEIQQ